MRGTRCAGYGAGLGLARVEFGRPSGPEVFSEEEQLVWESLACTATVLGTQGRWGWLWEGAKRSIPASLLLTEQGFGIKVDEEGLEINGDGNGREEVAERRVKTSRRAVSWVESAGYVSCVEDKLTCLFELMNSSKHFVSGFVAATSFPPPLNDTSVVSKDFDVVLMWLAYKAAKRYGEELEADCFGPANVAAFCFPTGEEAPSSPFVANDDANAHTGAGV